METIAIEELLEKSLLMSLGFMGLPKVNKIFKVIASEISYNSKCREFFLEEFILVPRVTLKELFKKLIAKGLVRNEDPQLLAMEFYSFVIYKFYEDYMLRGESNMDFEKMKIEFTRHIRFFVGMVRSNNKKGVM
jgi:hypothetical protein